MKILILTLLTTLSLSAIKARAGAEGHGGGGFKCKGHMDLLDLWEGEHDPMNYTIKYNNKPIQRQIQDALNKLDGVDSYLASEVAKEVKYIQSHMIPIKEDEEIPFPLDAKNKIKERGCVPVGLAQFDDEIMKLKYDAKYLPLLNRTKLAALFVHEGIYKVMRENMKSTDSVGSRRLNACLFAKDDCIPLIPVLDGIPTTGDLYQCTSRYTDFYLYGVKRPYNSSPDSMLQFTRLYVPLKTKTTFEDGGNLFLTYVLHEKWGYEKRGSFQGSEASDLFPVKSSLSKYGWGIKMRMGFSYSYSAVPSEPADRNDVVIPTIELVDKTLDGPFGDETTCIKLR